jgi:hypothetical protein
LDGSIKSDRNGNDGSFSNWNYCDDEIFLMMN